MSDIGSPAGARELSGTDKVAALLLALDRPIAAQLLRRFGADEVREVARSAAELGWVPSELVESLAEEFTSHFSHGAEILGSVGEAAELIAGVLPPEDVASIMSDLMGSSNESVWVRLNAVSESELATFLNGEHPQTAAVILNRLKSATVAKVMSSMSSAFRKRVVTRMLGSKSVTEASMRLVEVGLQDDLLKEKRSAAPVDMSIRFAEMLNKMERDQMEEMLDTLTEAKPELAEAVRGRLFTFEDIVKLSGKARGILFDKVPAEKLVLALRGTEEEFCQIVLSSLASRARRMVEGELRSGGSVNQKEVMAARRLIADTVLDLADRGQIELRGPPEEAPPAAA
ncbi:MAG: flagellar motor switch protein FliG [Hyphomicrobiales bacterium]|nr:flagellar motor switch protein FliG [Hyphomicrobiales bacterium]